MLTCSPKLLRWILFFPAFCAAWEKEDHTVRVEIAGTWVGRQGVSLTNRSTDSPSLFIVSYPGIGINFPRHCIMKVGERYTVFTSVRSYCSWKKIQGTFANHVLTHNSEEGNETSFQVVSKVITWTTRWSHCKYVSVHRLWETLKGSQYIWFHLY